MSRLIRVLTFLSFAYIVIIIVGAASSMLLPAARDLEIAVRETSCSWQNSLIISVVCDGDVFAGILKTWFFNLWFFLLAAPAIAFNALFDRPLLGLVMSLISVVLYAPITFLVWRMISRWAKKRRAKE